MKVTNLTSGEVAIRKNGKVVGILAPLGRDIDTKKWKVLGYANTNLKRLEQMRVIRVTD